MQKIKVSAALRIDSSKMKQAEGRGRQFIATSTIHCAARLCQIAGRRVQRLPVLVLL